MKSSSNPVITLQDGIIRLCNVIGTQAGEHIKPIHAHCAARLVLEGGFPPEWVSPRPPYSSKRISNAVHALQYTEGAADKVERRVLGGIKYKNVDVTAVVNGLGPSLGISAKSTGNAFRNLTNRMEEALGECTNVHMMYPGFVFGFLHLIKFAKESETGNPQDASFNEKNEPLAPIRRYHEVLVGLSGRNAITDPGMRYESVALLVYRCRGSRAEIWPKYPSPESPVHFSRFFQRLYDLYDLRFAYPDPDGPNNRKAWKPKGIPVATRLDTNLPFPWETRLAGE
ncbi:MAG TPA: hypothetical protein VGS15_10455 [Candidatus Acidoferrales bacterium]|nr:hypothetical protein [Candidatus Acidoferrales bacterium]